VQDFTGKLGEHQSLCSSFADILSEAADVPAKDGIPEALEEDIPDMR
jgi:hypothetical protein